MNSFWKWVAPAVAFLVTAPVVTAVPTTGRAQGIGLPSGERVVDETVAVIDTAAREMTKGLKVGKEPNRIMPRRTNR